MHDNCDLSRSAKWEVWPYAVAETFAKAAGRGVNRVQCGKDYFKDDSGTCVPRIQISIPNGNGMPEWPAWPSTDTDEDSDNDDQIDEIKESSDEPIGNLTSSQIVQKNMTNQIQNPSVIGGKEKDENLNNQSIDRAKNWTNPSEASESKKCGSRRCWWTWRQCKYHNSLSRHYIHFY